MNREGGKTGASALVSAKTRSLIAIALAVFATTARVFATPRSLIAIALEVFATPARVFATPARVFAATRSSRIFSPTNGPTMSHTCDKSTATIENKWLARGKNTWASSLTNEDPSGGACCARRACLRDPNETYGETPMTMNNRINNQSKDQKMIAGIDKHLKSLPSILIGSQNMTPAAIIQIFQDRIATGQRAQSARAAWLETVKADRAKRAQTAPTVAAFKRAVEGMFYDATSTLDDFGLTPVKKPKTKVDTKAAAAAKTRATRKVRGTLGKKQKKAVKGTTPSATTGSTANTPTATGPGPAAPTPKPNA